MIFTKEQRKIYSRIHSYLNDDESNKLLILGPSGSGKTTVVTQSIYEYCTKYSVSIENVYFCAFTNKATKVLRNMVADIIRSLDSSIQDDSIKNPQFATIHGMLMLEPNTIRMEDIKHNKRRIQRIKENLTRKIYEYELLKKYLKNEDIQLAEDESTVDRGDDILLFDYDFRRLKSFEDIDIIVIDECSTISKELYVYIESTIRWMHDNFGHNIKIIYLGDYYQLPPVGERKSIIFEVGMREKWPLYKLSKVMRAKTDQMSYVNDCHLDFIRRYLKTKKLTSRRIGSPYFIIEQKYSTYITRYNTFIEKYVSLKDEDKIMITYSKNNSAKLNLSVQKMLDFDNKISRPPDMEYSAAYKYVPPFINFLEKDRIMLARPINIPKYIIKEIGKDKNDEDKTKTYCINLDETGEKLYSGDIFIVVKSTKVKIRTIMNTYDRFNYTNVPESFNGEMLEIKYLDVSDKKKKDKEKDKKETSSNKERERHSDERSESELASKTKIVFQVDNLESEKCRRALRNKLGWDEYTGVMQIFRKTFSIIKRGHCMTCYKSQGSEYKHVFVNLKSFWYSLLSDRRKKPRQLFSAFYTATTRASEKLYLYY